MHHRETPGKNAEKVDSLHLTHHERSVQCGPVAFVGDDQFIEDSFRHRSAGHRFRQGDGLPQFLVTALNRASTTSFSTATCCSINPFWNDGIFPIASGSGPLTPTGRGLPPSPSHRSWRWLRCSRRSTASAHGC